MFLALRCVNQCLTMLEGRQEQIEHVVGLLAVRGHEWKLHATISCPVLQSLIVVLPYLASPGLYPVLLFELGIQEGGENVRGQVARTHIYPGVLVYLTAEEAACDRCPFPAQSRLAPYTADH